MAKEAPATEKTPAKPAPLSAEAIAKELTAAKAGELPGVAFETAADGALVRLDYATSELHAARASVDAEAIASLSGHAVAEASQQDRHASRAGALVHAGAVCTFVLRRG